MSNRSNENDDSVVSFVTEKDKELPSLSSKLSAANLQDVLKQQYDHYNHIENYWKKFDVYSSFDPDTSYNNNIIIEDENEKLKNIADLFSNNCKRLAIVSDAGGGKSALIHEMARQWCKGENPWTHQFSFLFLFRLSEISECEIQSLRTLIRKYLNSTDADLLLNNFICMEKCLFLFDGLDELEQEFFERMELIVFSKEIQPAHIIITSRPCQQIFQLESNWRYGLHLELKGYTDKGIDEQLNKYSIDPGECGNDVRDLLTVPLLNMLHCITRKTTIRKNIMSNRVCSAIETFIRFAFDRYRNVCKNFTEIEQNEILLILGQVELSVKKAVGTSKKPISMWNQKIEYPHIHQELLSTSIDVGLIHKKSTPINIIFVNQFIADYCAAYFWIRTNPMEVKTVSSLQNPVKLIEFVTPPGCSLHMGSYISCFLSYFSRNYKECLWRKFVDAVPLLDEYVTLPRRQLNGDNIHLGFVFASDQITVLDKIKFPPNGKNPFLYLSYVRFETGTKFEHIAKMDSLSLAECTFNMNPEEFFQSYNILRRLVFYNCKSNNENIINENIVVNKHGCEKNDLPLMYLEISHCDLSMTCIVSYIMANCLALDTFKLMQSFERKYKEYWMLIESDSDDGNFAECDDNGSDGEYYGNGWIKELQNNHQLLHSIQHFELEYIGVDDLTILFETLRMFINLKTMKLKVWEELSARLLTKPELNALEMSLENGLKNLRYIETSLKDENDEEIDLRRYVCETTTHTH